MVALTLWVAVVAGTVFAVDQTQANAHRAVRERFEVRATVASRFVEAWVAEHFRRQHTVAINLLGGSVVTEEDVRRAALALEYPAVILLDAQGRVIQAVPSKPGLIGTDLTAQYAHLRAAVAGDRAISSVVPSAAEQRPIVAFAIPFDTPAGRRVFSGGFDVSNTPLAAFLKNAVQVRPNRAYLIDQSSGVVATSVSDSRGTGFSPFNEADPELAAALERSDAGSFSRANGTDYFTSAAVAGTPWTIVLSQPTRVIFGPIGMQGPILWTLALGIALAGLLIVRLVVRLANVGAERKAAIARLEANEVELATARDAALLASAQKSAFLATMSHEIRTPMAAVIGLSDLLLDSPLDEGQLEMVSMISASGTSLLTLVDELLDVAKAEAGKLSIEADEFVLRDVVHNVHQLLGVIARAKGLLLTAVVDDEVPARVLGDPARLRQVLTNLVGNAIKFTAEGEVSIRVTTVEVSATSVLARFEVQDTGVGIAPEKHAAVFEPFSQAEHSTTRDFGGTGLGLAITRELVGLMGGSCGVTSDLGQGATFWFTSRFGAVEASTDGATTGSSPSASTSAMPVAASNASRT
ncbi:MAG: ATP-binding protein [Acidimicrobiales bacterium]|nr:ATP-binding protein [Acidimicrobiales bacterium]